MPRRSITLHFIDLPFNIHGEKNILKILGMFHYSFASNYYYYNINDINVTMKYN